MRIGRLFTSHQSAPQRDSQNKEMQEYTVYEVEGGICLISQDFKRVPHVSLSACLVVYCLTCSLQQHYV